MLSKVRNPLAAENRNTRDILGNRSTSEEVEQFHGIRFYSIHSNPIEEFNIAFLRVFFLSENI